MEYKGINLGRLFNKYLIIDIMYYATERYGIYEAEQLLHSCSKKHRNFLPINRSWYSRTLSLTVSLQLKELSAQLKDIHQATFILE